MVVVQLGVVQMGVVQLGVVQLGVVQMTPNPKFALATFWLGGLITS